MALAKPATHFKSGGSHDHLQLFVLPNDLTAHQIEFYETKGSRMKRAGGVTFRESRTQTLLLNAAVSAG